MAALETHLHTHHSQEILAPLSIATNYQAPGPSLADGQRPASLSVRTTQVSSPAENVGPEVDKVSPVIY